MNTTFASPTLSTDSNLRFSQTMSSPPSSPIVDRFIPRREASFSRDLSNYISTSAEQEKTRPVENDMSPAKEDYRKALRETILSGDSPRKILMVSSPTSSGKKRVGLEGNVGGISPSDSASSSGGDGTKRKRPARFIPKSPDKILDAPDLVDDYYLNLLDWSSTNTVAVALGQSVFLWNASTGATHKLVETTGSGNIVTSLAWASNGNSLAIGTHSAEVQLWDVEASIEIRRMRCVFSNAAHP
jgi:cell division cycle protein 20 (cofactor of APC complex)